MATVSKDGKLASMIWSDQEMVGISWHDAHLRAMLLGDNGAQVLFDFDFICEWHGPHEKNGVFSFDVAPATLVFPYAYEIEVSLYTGAPMSIFGIDKENPVPHGNTIVWTWTIDGPHGQISLRATGFVLYFRREPLPTQSQLLTLQERGGIAFDIPGGYKE